MLAPIASKLPVGIERLERVLRPLVGRMIVMQGYLHSGDSPGMTLELKADGVRLLGDDPAEGIARVRRLVRRLTANAHLLGMAPIPGLTQLGRPGKGNHVGGSLPMRHRPSELETDTMGRVPGWDRVHVVDSSVLPSLPATTVTLSVMANAHRIAAAAAVGAD
jgi:choline dehydrogenase-like flavoprotein